MKKGRGEMLNEQHNPNLGLLLTPDIKLHRVWFQQMVDLLGIQILYYQVKPGKHYTNYTEIKTTHYDPIRVGCIFDEHPTQKTLKKMGWVAELQENSSIIHLAYDTPGIQVGALVSIPSGIDGTPDRIFRVVSMEVSMIYPASIACEIVPEYKDVFEPSLLNYKHTNFNLLDEED